MICHWCRFLLIGLPLFLVGVDMIVEKDKYKEVSQIIFQNMDLDKEGNGILFVEPLSEVHGLVNQLPSE